MDSSHQPSLERSERDTLDAQDTLDVDDRMVVPMPRGGDVPTLTTGAGSGSLTRRRRQGAAGQRLFARGELLQGIYQVGDVLGTGGMGQVFAAVDQQLDREVAIKACWPEVGREVLHTEARSLAALRHPGVVVVYSVGSHRDIDFMVMERLRGLTLHDHMIRRGRHAPFSVEKTLDLLIDIADTLVVVHRAGLIHRDLKPTNIMLAPGDRTILLDLGICLRGEHVASQARIAGSPHYMAPEAVTATMAGGSGHLVDIYALGIIAFEMLTGRRPFEHGEVSRILDMQVHTPPPALDELAPDVPVHLSRLVGEMIRKTPAERPQSAEVVSAWLRGIRRSPRAEACPTEKPARCR